MEKSPNNAKHAAHDPTFQLSSFPLKVISVQFSLICLLWHRYGADETSWIRPRLDSFWCGSSLICQSKPSFKFTMKMWTGWMSEPHHAERRGALTFLHHIPQGHLKAFRQLFQSGHSRNSCIITGVLRNNTNISSEASKVLLLSTLPRRRLVWRSALFNINDWKYRASLEQWIWVTTWLKMAS